MNLQEALNKTLKDRKIKGVELAASVGCSPSHISKICGGYECTLMMLERILVALEHLSPGSKAHFCGLWLGLQVSEAVQAFNVEQAINALTLAPITDEQLASLLTIASQRLRKPQPEKQAEAVHSQIPVAV